MNCFRLVGASLPLGFCSRGAISAQLLVVGVAPAPLRFLVPAADRRDLQKCSFSPPPPQHNRLMPLCYCIDYLCSINMRVSLTMSAPASGVCDVSGNKSDMWGGSKSLICRHLGEELDDCDLLGGAPSGAVAERGRVCCVSASILARWCSSLPTALQRQRIGKPTRGGAA